MRKSPINQSLTGFEKYGKSSPDFPYLLSEELPYFHDFSSKHHSCFFLKFTQIITATLQGRRGLRASYWHPVNTLCLKIARSFYSRKKKPHMPRNWCEAKGFFTKRLSVNTKSGGI